MQYSYAYGASENLARIGWYQFWWWCLPAIYESKISYRLYGVSTVIGASGGPLWIIGADVMSFSKINEEKEDFDGVQLNAGVGVGVDVHIAQNYTGSFINNTTVNNLTASEIKKYTLKEKLMFGGI